MERIYSSHGSLQGASTSPLNSLELPDPIVPIKLKSFMIKVPKGVKSGQTIWASVPGRKPFQTVIPPGKVEGNTFVATIEQSIIDSVYASTLQSLPGMIVVMTKPIIYASASTTKVATKTLPFAIGELTKEVNAKILEQATQCDCNAVLGMVFNVVVTEFQEGNLTVTVFGTPCIVVISGEMMQNVIVTTEATPTAPIAEAHMIIQPIVSKAVGVE